MSFIIPANTLSGGFSVDFSAQFSYASSDNLRRTFGTPTDNKKWTYSIWLRNTDVSTRSVPFLNTGADTSYIYYRSGSADPAPNALSIEQYVGGFQYRLITNATYTDEANFHHFVIAADTTQGTASNRIKLYVDGTQITSWNTSQFPSQNLDTEVNKNILHIISGHNSSAYFTGYMSEITFIDGQQLAATDFGIDDGTWKPIEISSDNLTFGNNGFYLPFTNASNLGEDYSGNDNDFTVNNLTSGDQSTVTPTNNS